MRFSDIQEELKEILGTCGLAVQFRAVTRAVQLLANSGLFDPLLGNLDFSIDGSYFIALPRDVKTPIRINIESEPAFIRSRLFEFSLNTVGSAEDEETDWSWADRGQIPIQNENALPGALNALAGVSGDDGKTIKVIGLDGNGIKQTETLTMKSVDPVVGQIVFYRIDDVIKDITIGEVFLRVDTSSVARYYPDEEQPMYRLIKLSKTGVACRMLYRKHVFKITSVDDIIPLHSEMAVILATQAVREYQNNHPEEAEKLLVTARAMIKEEQDSRDEFSIQAVDAQITTAINANINTRDSIIVADLYDVASEIAGPVGRKKVYDMMTNAIEALSNKGNWDSLVGWVDIWKPDRSQTIQPNGNHTGDGIFTLPRFVEAPLAVNICGEPGFARNRWFEFHLNGPGERSNSSCQTWDDLGEVVTIAPLPLKAETPHKTNPVYLWAVPQDALDEDKAIRVYGYELDAADNEIEVIRNEQKGYLVPCKTSAVVIPSGAPRFVRIDRITKESSKSFIKLFTVAPSGVATDLMIGYWYPDETEPKYRQIKVHNCSSVRIRMRYRKRANKITCLHEPIPLRSRLAVENMMRGLMLERTDPAKAEVFQQSAIRYLGEEQSAQNGVAPFSLQFNSSVMPGVRQNFN